MKIDHRAVVAANPERVELAGSMNGWCSAIQGAHLYELARLGPPDTTVVEVGSWQGRSTAWLGWGVQDSDHPERSVYAVDGFSDPTHGDGGRSEYKDPEEYSVFPKFQANMAQAGVDQTVQALVGWSPEAADLYDGSPIGVLYVDGLHEYDAVMADVEAWARWLVPGGVICFDDVRDKFGGVVRAVRDLQAQQRMQLLGRAPIPKGFEWFRWTP